MTEKSLTPPHELVTDALAYLFAYRHSAESPSNEVLSVLREQADWRMDAALKAAGFDLLSSRIQKVIIDAILGESLETQPQEPEVFEVGDTVEATEDRYPSAIPVDYHTHLPVDGTPPLIRKGDRFTIESIDENWGSLIFIGDDKRTGWYPGSFKKVSA